MRSQAHKPYRERLDKLVEQKGLSPSREKAQRAILAGLIFVDGQLITKVGTKVSSESTITLKEQERYVGRGAYKLEGALRHFQVDPTGWCCLDLGSSTGGFTDCLLQHGATEVTAIDVGKGQLAWSLRQDPRVILHEGVNARYLDATQFEKKFHLIVADLSFISLKKVLPAAFPLLQPGGSLILLIKPQFELSASEVGRGGIVREEGLRQKALLSIISWLEEQGYLVLEKMESPIKGTHGNIEFLVHASLPTHTTLKENEERA